jgi:DNA polymerase I-like protein with 3'-5' exonuclease and polymerase domains
MNNDDVDPSPEVEIEQPKKRSRKAKLITISPSGEEVSLKHIAKHFRDTLELHHKEAITSTEKGDRLWIIDLASPLTLWFKEGDNLREDTRALQPSRESPICQKCELFMDCKNPFLKPYGSEQPLMSVFYEFTSGTEDDQGQPGVGGIASRLRDIWNNMAIHAKMPFNRIRWVPMMRCANRPKKIVDENGKTVLVKKVVNPKTKINWCGLYAVQDVMMYTPNVMMPVGSVTLGFFSYKSNAQDWGGKLLTFRGWPDDWLMEPKYSKAVDGKRPGHPIYGQYDTNFRVPMFPVQTPGIIDATQIKKLKDAWLKSIVDAMKLASNGAPIRQYILDHYKISENPDEIIESLQWLIDHPKTLVAFDTETTGLKAFAESAAIVYVMLRWKDGDEPKSIGFPWDYPESPLKPHISRITPFLNKALESSVLVGHNLTFDALFAAANFEGSNLDRLGDACRYDTWHEAFVLRQAKGSLGLDMMAYQHVPELGGYDEDFSILIELERELLHPEQGGHYARCPDEYKETHLKPYVMGDVEVTYKTHEKLREKYDECKTYKIPLAHPTKRGKFRWYPTISRKQVYDKIVSPASGTLIKMMGRGLKVDLKELSFQEEMFPQLIFETRKKLREITPEVLEWCEYMESQTPGWFLDLESKDHLRTILYEKMRMPIKAITSAGQTRIKEGKFYVDRVEDVVGPIEKAEKAIRKVSRTEKDFEANWKDFLKVIAIDKFSLNGLSAENPKVRPLLEYRSIFKQYASYIRTIRNITTKGIDKKARTKDQHLARDGMVHTQFLITGTRSGRLSSRDPNLQQLPARGQVKRIYTSRFGDQGCLYQGDLSQIELRLIAAACGDEAMVDAYVKGIDLHSLTMSRIFKMPYDHCIKDHVSALQKAGKDKEAKECELKRKISKTINFLTGYGGGAQGLQGTLAQDGIYQTLEECEAFLEAFFDSYPALREYLSYYKGFIESNGVAVSMLGRVRIFEEAGSQDNGLKSKALRAGCNHLIQATASDMMLCCICAIETLMRDAGLKSILISTVHDSLLVDCIREELPMVHEIVMSVFTNIPDVLETWLGQDVDLSWTRVLPFDGDSEVGKNYLDMIKLSHGENDWADVFKRMDEE